MNLQINWDFFGIITSIACAIHCAILPLVMSSLPVFGMNIINNSLFEWTMISLAFLVGCYALLHGFRRHHKSLVPFFLFGTGFTFLVLKQFFHHAESLFLIPAIFFILSAHFLNYRYSNQPKMADSEGL